MAKQVTKATKGTDKATKGTDKAVEFARKQRAGVAAIEAAGGNAAPLTIANNPRMVVGGEGASKAEACFALLRKARTVGDYIAAREKAGMGATLGGYLPGWIEKGYVVVGSKGKAVAKASKGKAVAKAASEPASVEA
jgi:hypothetical protein